MVIWLLSCCLAQFILLVYHVLTVALIFFPKFWASTFATFNGIGGHGDAMSIIPRCVGLEFKTCYFADCSSSLLHVCSVSRGHYHYLNLANNFMSEAVIYAD